MNAWAVEQAAREQQRIAQLKNQWASISSSRANAMLAGYELANRGRQVARLIALDRMVNGE